MGRFRWLALLVVIATTVSSAYAQTSRGSVTGTVVDIQGAVLPNATVDLK
jgi:hypothetical protein